MIESAISHLLEGRRPPCGWNEEERLITRSEFRCSDKILESVAGAYEKDVCDSFVGKQKQKQVNSLSCL
ncbi:hypothetical protein QJS10_CPA08g00684 [Acorus calamus]|uniref:Uncharacterized protein n=1 Tax=Acorus calamus TaxID=4465 RepID=A0AAV9EFY3_ACOCL|nr:hypothetical protein QJS10_CPA08g00684 [Acorus calamus]